MVVISTRKSLQEYSSEMDVNLASIGFVPTMGALHQGHISLIEKAIQENKFVICSIFVNPTQFNNPEDLVNYPSTLEADIEKLKNTGCDLLFVPTVEEMYEKDQKTEIFELGVQEFIMEGSSRPGHFQGVCSIVNKLFNLIKPTRAYFGLKDFQQVCVIRQMIQQTGTVVELIPCEIVREKDGLAMSSRNMRLNDSERAEAPLLYQTLKMAVALKGLCSIKALNEKVENAFQDHPMFQLDYFKVVNNSTLLPVENWNDTNEMRACIAVTLGKIRLIDNMAII